MSEHVNETHRDQKALFPDTINKYVDKENPVRFKAARPHTQKGSKSI